MMERGKGRKNGEWLREGEGMSGGVKKREGGRRGGERGGEEERGRARRGRVERGERNEVKACKRLER